MPAPALVLVWDADRDTAYPEPDERWPRPVRTAFIAAAALFCWLPFGLLAWALR